MDFQSKQLKKMAEWLKEDKGFLLSETNVSHAKEAERPLIIKKKYVSPYLIIECHQYRSEEGYLSFVSIKTGDGEALLAPSSAMVKNVDAFKNVLHEFETNIKKKIENYQRNLKKAKS